MTTSSLPAATVSEYSTLSLQQIHPLLDSLYPPDALPYLLSLSQAERETLIPSAIESIPLQYGETQLSTLHFILQHCHPTSGCVFVDLGCGGGKTLVAAALLLNKQAERVIGIEIINSLYQHAKDITHTKLTKMMESMGVSLPSIQLLCGDFLSSSLWLSADIVFTCSTMFSLSMMKSLTIQCEQLKIGAYIITVSQPLILPPIKSQPMFMLLHRLESMQMSWGKATVFIYRKQHNRKLENVILRAFQRKAG